MSRGRDDENTREERDVVLGKALDELETPEYPPDFVASVWARVDAEEAAAGRVRPRRRPRSLWVRRPILAAAAVVAITAAVTTAVLIGLPGVSRVSGPETVSAAEVIQKALRAFSSGKTIQADATEKYATSMLPGGVPKYAVIGAHIVIRSDGSFRITRTRARQISWDTPGYSPYAPGVLPIDPDALDWAYDATSGVVRSYYRSSESPRYRCEVTTGYPLGPPDRWANLQADLGAVALALQAGRPVTLETTTYEGRPVWVVSMTGSLATRDPEERYSVTIDQHTCLPVRFRILGDGVVQLEYRWTNVRVDEPVPDTVFSFTAPKGVKVFRSDDGFRRVPLAQIDQAAGYALLLPTWLPDGYRQRWSAVARRATLVTEVTGRHVVAVQYTRGFDTLTITTRMVADAREAVEFDPFEPEPYWSDIVGRDVRLADGAFVGATARVVVAPRTTIPHLYAVKDGTLLTVAGNATTGELIAIAEALQLYRQGDPSSSATPDGPASAN